MKKIPLTAFALSSILAACGTASTPVTDPTPTPTPTATSTATTIHLEYYAKAEASSQASDEYAPDNVHDEALGDATHVTGYIWRPNTSINGSWIRLSWIAPVVISELRLYDNPQIGHQVTSGRVTFENSESPETDFDPIDFENLVDAGTPYTTISGPSAAVTSVTIAILDHIGASAGLAEVMVLGTFAGDEVTESDIAPYSRITDYSSVYGDLHDGTVKPFNNTGPYRTFKTKDESGSTEWISDHNGSNASIELSFGRAHVISYVKLTDRTGSVCDGGRWTKGWIRFLDTGTRKEFTKSEEENYAFVELDPAIEAESIEITFSEVTGTCIGLSDVQISGAYTP